MDRDVFDAAAGTVEVVARVRAELEAAGVAASIGWAAVTLENGFAAALDRADAAMYAAKLERRKRTSLSS